MHCNRTGTNGIKWLRRRDARRRAVSLFIMIAVRGETSARGPNFTTPAETDARVICAQIATNDLSPPAT